MAEHREQPVTRSFTPDTAIGFIGAGRLGSSLAIAMDRAGYRVAALSSRREAHRDWLNSRLPEASVYASPVEVAANSQIVFVTTSDSVIREVASGVQWRSEHALVHCSGAGSLDLLDSAVAAGAAVGGFHPLQTFPTRESADSFLGVTFGVEAPANMTIVEDPS